MARFPQLPNTPSPTHGQTLVYDDNLKRWVPSDGGGGGGAGIAPIMNLNSSDDKITTITINSDGTPTDAWPNRWEWIYNAGGGVNPVLVNWVNEYGEQRYIPARHNTVAHRVFVATDATSFAARSASAPVWEVANHRNGARATIVGVYKDRMECNAPLNVAGAISASNLGVAGIAVNPASTPPNGWLVIRTS